MKRLRFTVALLLLLTFGLFQANSGADQVIIGGLNNTPSLTVGTLAVSTTQTVGTTLSVGTTLTVGTSLTVGASTPTAITNIRVYAPSLTPTISSAAIQTTEQTFTVSGLTTADKVFVNGPVPTSLCPAVTFRVSAADTLAIGFSTLTASACTPAAGTYNIVAVRS